MITIAPFKPGEGAILLEMTKELAKTHFPDGISAKAEDFEKALFGDDPIIGALLARVDGVAAGAALWHRSFSTNLGKEVMYLEDLTVLPDFRRRGVANALLKAVAKFAVERGYSKIFWLAMEWNSGALALYQSVGAQIEKANCYCWIEGDALRALSS